MNHTPGPWGVQNKGTLGKRSARHEVVQGVNYDGTKNLPTIVKMPDLSEKSYANARLIAAAPHLLEMCRVALEMPVPTPRSRQGRQDLLTYRKEIKRAIAKATEA